MATELPPNTPTELALGTTLSEVKIFSRWLLVWGSDGETVYVATGALAHGDALPATARPIPASAIPFPFDVEPYGGTLFLAASAACTALLEGRD